MINKWLYAYYNSSQSTIENTYRKGKLTARMAFNTKCD